MVARVTVLAAVTMLVWLPAGVTARWLWGDQVAVCSLIAAAVCLAPGVVTVMWAAWAARRSRTHLLAAAVGCSWIRVAAVITAVLVLNSGVGFIREEPSFCWWVFFFYLVTLGVEIALMVLGPGAPAALSPARAVVTAGGAENSHGA